MVRIKRAYEKPAPGSGSSRGGARRYHTELRAGPARSSLAELTRRAAAGTVTLVFGARDEEHNGAVVRRDAIEDGLREHARWRRASAGRRARMDRIVVRRVDVAVEKPGSLRFARSPAVEITREQ